VHQGLFNFANQESVKGLEVYFNEKNTFTADELICIFIRSLFKTHGDVTCVWNRELPEMN